MCWQRILLCVLIIWASAPNATPNKATPTRFTISYFEHESVGPFIKLISQVYADIDIVTEFVPLPLTRGYTEVNEGTVDADVGRVKDFTRGFNNILVIEPPLYIAELILLCTKGLPCGPLILKDPDNTILSNIGNQNALRNIEIQADIQTIENMRATIEMLRLGRVNYVVYGSTKQLRHELESEFELAVLQQIPIHHVINIKHRHIKAKLEAALKKRLSQFNPDR